MYKLIKNKKGLNLANMVIMIILLGISAFIIFKGIIPTGNNFSECNADCEKIKPIASNEYFAIEYIGMNQKSLTNATNTTCKFIGDNTYECYKDMPVYFYIGINNTGPKQTSIRPKIVVGFQCTDNNYEKCETKEWIESNSCVNIDTQKDCPVNGYKFQNPGTYTIYPAARCDHNACGTGARCNEGLLFLNNKQFLTIEVS